MTINNLHFRSALICTFFLFVFNIQNANSQVGIGTTSPDASSALDVTSTTTGVLFPRMTTALRDLISNPATGLLIFNTSTNTFNYNFGTSGTPNWINVGTNETRAVKYRSTDTTTDLNNATTTPIPLFGSLDFNDDTNLFELQSNTTIQVNEAGRYRITVNLLTNGTAGDDQLQLGVFINGIIQGAPFATNDLTTSIIHSSCNYSDVLNLSVNDQISIQSEDFIGGGTITMRDFNGVTSNITIEKIN